MCRLTARQRIGNLPDVRILLVTRQLAPDALNAHAVVAADLYADAVRHADVRLVSGWVEDRSRIPSEALGVDLCGRRDPGAGLALRRAAARTAKTFNPDVVVTTELSVSRRRRPSVAWIWSAPDRGLGGRTRLARLGTFDRVVVPGSPVRADLVEAGLDEERITVIPPGVDDLRLARRPGPRDRLRVIAVGRIAPERGQHVAIDAIARLSPVGKARVQLDIVGRVADPVYLEQLRVQAWQQPVRFHLDVPDVAPFYRDADLALYPTLVDEAVPFGAIEALAAGVPLLCSDRPEIRTATGGFATSVEASETGDWRDHVRRWLDDPTPFEALAAQGRAHVRATRGRDTTWRQWEALLASLTGG